MRAMQGQMITGEVKLQSKGRVRNSLLKTHKGTAICMKEIFFKITVGWGFCTRGFPLSCLGRPTVKISFLRFIYYVAKIK